jgi:hypothetical protein
MLSILPLLMILGASAQQPAADGAVVIGRVVDAASGRPIPGAILTLNGSAAATPRAPAPPSSRMPPRVMTNGTGQFAIRGLRAGTLFLNVTKGGYVDATLGQRRPGGSTQPLQIGENQRITGVEIRMWKTAAIAGTVVDEAGEPVVGVRVHAFRRTLIAGRMRAAPTVFSTTDDRGAYRLATLTPGDYHVAVVSPQAAPSPSGALIYPTTFYPAAPTAEQAGAIGVKAGEERLGIDVQLQPVRAVRVSGVLVAPLELVGRVPVRLARVGTEDIIAGLDAASTQTNGDGTFTFPSVPAGTYTVSVVRVPREPAAAPDTTAAVARAGVVAVTTSATPVAGPSAPAPVPADATLCARTTLAVGNADVIDVSLVLRPGARVSGRVAFDGSGERPDEAALANTRIALDPVDGSALPDGLGVVSGRIDANGGFTTFGLPSGKYYVRVSGLSDWYLKSAFHEGHDLADEPIALDTTDVSDVVLTFTDRPSSLVGTVRTGSSTDGTAVVLAFPVDSTAWLSTGLAPRRMRTARASKDGSYIFPALAPGAYYVAAVQEDTIGEWQDPMFLESLSRSASEVRLAEGERKGQDLRTIPVR